MITRSCVRLALGFVVLTCAFGCGSDGGSGGSATDAGSIRVVNVVPDSPSLSVSLGSNSLGSVSYGQASGLASVSPTDYELNVQFVRPDGTVTTVVEDLTISIRANQQTTVLLIGPLESVSTRVITQPDPDLSATAAEVWFVNASTSRDSLDFFLDSTDATLDSLSPTASLAFGANANLVEVPAGSNYRLRTAPNGAATADYDSGIFAIRALTRRLYVACDYFGPGGSGTRVIQVDTVSASTFPAEILDAGVRFANLIATQSAVDVYVDGTRIVEGLGYGQLSEFVEREASNPTAAFTVAGTPSATLYSTILNLTPGEYRTLAVARSTSGALVSRAVAESLRPIAGVASISTLQASPSSASVDLYFLAPGQPLSDASPVFRGLGFMVNGAFELEAAQYDVVAAPADEDTVTTGPERINVLAGGLYTVMLTDAQGGGIPGEIVFHDDRPN